MYSVHHGVFIVKSAIFDHPFHQRRSNFTPKNMSFGLPHTSLDHYRIDHIICDLCPVKPCLLFLFSPQWKGGSSAYFKELLLYDTEAKLK